MTPPAEDFFLEDRVETRGVDWRLLRRLLRYVAPHRGILAAALAALVLGTACQLAGPYIIKIVIDRHITPGPLSGMEGWVLLFLGAILGAMGFLYLQMYAVSVLGQRVILAIRKEMFSRVQRLPVSWFDRTPTGRMMTRLTSDVEALQELISSGLVSTIGDAALLAGTAAILLGMNARLALVVFSVLPLLVLFVELIKRRIRGANREARRKLARMNAFLQEHVTGVAVVKAFGKEDRSDGDFDARNADYIAENIRLTNFYSLFFPGVELFASIAVALLIWRGGENVISGAITFGTLVAFLEYAQRFYNPIKDMSDKYSILQAALASSGADLPAARRESFARIRGAFTRTGDGKGGDGDAGPPGRRCAGDRVPGRLVLLPANRRGGVRRGTARAAGAPRGFLRPGEGDRRGRSWERPGRGRPRCSPCCAGSTRSSGGKSSFTERTSGKSRATELRGRISLVLQEPFLFSGSVLENVSSGGPECRRRHVGDEGGPVRVRPGQRLSTPVGERGGRLSMGQRQMVSFARALARDPDILLLDEATSSVDPVTEHGIREALPAFLSGRTALIVAHRLSTVLSADRIFVMHKGKVRESGTHEELLAAGGIYQRLHVPPVRQISWFLITKFCYIYRFHHFRTGGSPWRRTWYSRRAFPASNPLGAEKSGISTRWTGSSCWWLPTGSPPSTWCSRTASPERERC